MFYFRFAILFLYFSFVYTVAESDVLILSTSSGQMLGTVLFTQSGRKFHAFLGVPYAASPVGNKRFQAPDAFGSWEGIRNFTSEAPLCLQVDKFTSEIVGSEDCLFLNVYTPKFIRGIHSTKFLPVMVFIHGGAFAFGVSTPTFRGPGRLLERDIVLVTINYRLGPLGFLSTATSTAPGNYGMLDQVMALNWVQENIRHFGGDKDRVTLFGDSAGGASVIYHQLSPLSKGLFHRGIAMSGSPLCPWALQEDPRYWALHLASGVGCPTEDILTMINCLRRVPATSLMIQAHDYFKFSFLPVAFAPVIDDYQSSSSSFLPDHPRNLLRQGRVNPGVLMMGITKDEGALVYAEILSENRTNLTSSSDIKMVLSAAMDEPQKQLLSLENVENYYVPERFYNDSNTVRSGIIQMLSDCLFRACHFETVYWLIKNGMYPYVYSHDYKPEQFTVTQLFGITDDIGVGHVDYLPFLFDGNVFGYHNLRGHDLAVSELLTAMWTNFATNGTPIGKNESVNWNPASSQVYDILSIDIPMKLHHDFQLSKNEALLQWMPLFSRYKKRTEPTTVIRTIQLTDMILNFVLSM